VFKAKTSTRPALRFRFARLFDGVGQNKCPKWARARGQTLTPACECISLAGYSIAALAAVSCISINFNQSESAQAFARICGASLLIASLFAAEFAVPKDPAVLSRHERLARSFFSLAAMFALCILKLFLYDLRNLETAYRILSFIALGRHPARGLTDLYALPSPDSTLSLSVLERRRLERAVR
jgi:hypothetical protein